MTLGVSREDVANVARYGRGAYETIRNNRQQPPRDYDAWVSDRAAQLLAERNQGPGPVTYGRGNGKYAGFDTQGQLGDYGIGRGRLMRDEALGYADEVAGLADDAYTRIEDIYRQELEKAAGGLARPEDDPELAAAVGNKMRGASPDAIEYRLSRPMTEADRYLSVDTPEIDGRLVSAPKRPGTPDARGLDVALGGTWESPGTYTATVGPAGGPVRYAPNPDVLTGVPSENPYEMTWAEGRPRTITYPGQDLWEADTADRAAYDERKAAMDAWAEVAGQDILGYAAEAGDRAQTPMTEFARQALIDIGVDPALAAGMYGPQEQYSEQNAEMNLAGLPIDEFNLNRDLTSLAENGVPWADYQRMLDDAEAAGRDQSKLAAEADAEAWSRAIQDATGVAGDALAESADVAPDYLTELVASGTLAQYDDALKSMWESGTLSENPMMLDQWVADLATNQPDLLRVFQAMYPTLLPKVDATFYGYEPAG